MTIKTPNYTVTSCNEFSVKDDGIYLCTEIWKTEEDEVRSEKLIIPKDIFVDAFNSWCGSNIINEFERRLLNNDVIDKSVVRRVATQMRGDTNGR